MPGPSPSMNKAFALFYSTYLLTVFGTLERIGVRKADVPDIAQQVFLKIYKNFDKRPAERVHSWVQLICEQQAADHYRLHRNRFETPEPNIGVDVPHNDDVHEQFERCEIGAIVRQVLEGMDAPLREVLIRYEFHDESLESIANSLGIARNTVTVRLTEAKRIFAIRTKRILGDDRYSLMPLPLFGAETFRDADWQSGAFIDEMRDRIWRGIARESGLDEMLFDPSESSPPLSRRENNRILRRILDSRGFLVGTGVVAGVIAALLWPRDLERTKMLVSTVVPVSNAQQYPIVEFAPNIEPAPAIVEPFAELPKKTQISAKPTPAAAVTSPKSEVDHEMRKLEEARELLDKAQYAEALAMLIRHKNEYPDSELASIRSRYIVLAREGQRQSDTAAANTP